MERTKEGSNAARIDDRYRLHDVMAKARIHRHPGIDSPVPCSRKRSLHPFEKPYHSACCEQVI
ncbi:MAG: hypothetical protein M0Z37_09450 [Nitrospiraceae bacterium]|nr:hypothetical protein [Nitrospiraceae bacterium]